MTKFIKASHDRPTLTVQYIGDDGKILLRTGGTIAWRFNNPGNVRPKKINLKLNAFFFVLVANVIFLSQAIASENSTILSGYILNKKSIDEQNKVHPYDVVLLPVAQNFYLKEEDEEYKKIKEIQLNYLDKKYKIEYKKPVKISCKNLYSADSMFHYTNLICVVDKISYIK